jgi:hypothetical protein
MGIGQNRRGLVSSAGGRSDVSAMPTSARCTALESAMPSVGCFAVMDARFTIDECDRLFAWETSTLGGLDILFNNTVGPATGGGLDVSDDSGGSPSI